MRLVEREEEGWWGAGGWREGRLQVKGRQVLLIVLPPPLLPLFLSTFNVIYIYRSLFILRFWKYIYIYMHILRHETGYLLACLYLSSHRFFLGFMCPVGIRFPTQPPNLLMPPSSPSPNVVVPFLPPFPNFYSACVYVYRFFPFSF